MRGYEYATPGAYFVTICAYGRACLFGDIVDGEMCLNEYGAVVVDCWKDLSVHYPHVELDEFVVMPNHLHGIIVIRTDSEINVGAGFKPAPTGSTRTKRHGLTEVVRGFKTFSARRINIIRAAPGTPVWQRSYYDHVIRGEEELDRVREYIQGNPAKWLEDVENPRNA